MPISENAPQSPKYKSPRHKLLKFFEKSRDKWKEKYQELKYRARLLSSQVYYLKNKNAELKQRIKELEKEPQFWGHLT